MRPLLLRSEDPPADEVVVVRAGVLNRDDAMRAARRAYGETGVLALSVFAALDHAVGVVARHEALTLDVGELPTFASHCLGDEGCGRLLGREHSRGVELHQLHVHEPAAGLEGKGHALAVVLVAPRGAAPPEASMAAGAQHHGVGHEGVRSPLARSKAMAPKQAPSCTSRRDTYWPSMKGMASWSTLAARVRRMARPE